MFQPYCSSQIFEQFDSSFFNSLEVQRFFPLMETVKKQLIKNCQISGLDHTSSVKGAAFKNYPQIDEEHSPLSACSPKKGLFDEYSNPSTAFTPEKKSTMCDDDASISNLESLFLNRNITLRPL